jgi:hypothetical protein
VTSAPAGGPVTGGAGTSRNTNVVTSDGELTETRNAWSRYVDVVCEGCAGQITVDRYGMGPRPRYCGAACRQAAYRARKKAEQS